MKIASVCTDGPTVRSEINGWGYEDSDLYVRGKHIGATPSPREHHHGTILEMLADGWKLLAPPADESFTTEDGRRIEQHEWWLTKEGR